MPATFQPSGVARRAVPSRSARQLSNLESSFVSNLFGTVVSSSAAARLPPLSVGWYIGPRRPTAPSAARFRRLRSSLGPKNDDRTFFASRRFDFSGVAGCAGARTRRRSGCRCVSAYCTGPPKTAAGGQRRSSSASKNDLRNGRLRCVRSDVEQRHAKLVSSAENVGSGASSVPTEFGDRPTALVLSLVCFVSYLVSLCRLDAAKH